MDAEFPVYSIAKTFLAQAVLALQIPIDDKVGNHLENLAPTHSELKIASLLNHTSGLSDYSELSDYRDSVSKKLPAWSRELLLEKSLQLPNNHDVFHYSNVGYLILRMLIEQKTQLSMFGAIRELVLYPLSIKGFSEWETKSDLVTDYDPKWVYSGTFQATEQSILDGYLKLIQHRAETTGLAAGLTSVPYPNTGFENPHYGLGIMSDMHTNNDQPLFVGHGGGGPGYFHMILVNTKTWQIAIESSTTLFNQAEAIGRLREQTSH